VQNNGQYSHDRIYHRHMELLKSARDPAFQSEDLFWRHIFSPRKLDFRQKSKQTTPFVIIRTC